jgi:hypothetical protein
LDQHLTVNESGYSGGGKRLSATLTIIGFNHWPSEGQPHAVVRMQKRRKVPPGLRLTIEQIGRELRDVYPARENLPPQLRALAKELKRKITARRQNRRRANEG